MSNLRACRARATDGFTLLEVMAVLAIGIIIAGDRAAIEPGIRALNAGPIKILTVDDVFGSAPTIGK